MKQEARERSRAGRKAGAQANNEENQGTGQAPAKASGSQKPPRGPVVKSRSGPAMTLQRLVDQYVKKEEEAKKQQEESSKQSHPSSSQVTNTIDSRSAGTTPKPQRSSSQKGMSLNSRTISQSAHKLDPVDGKARSSRAGGGHEHKRSADA